MAAGQPKYMVKETDLGWCIFIYHDQTWVHLNAGLWNSQKYAEEALRGHIRRTIKNAELERARRAQATYYDDLGTRTMFAGAGAMGAV